MKIAKSAVWALTVIGVLAGCGTGAPQPVTFPGPRLVPSQVIRPNRRKLWIAPDISRSAQLLFESDIGTNNVDIFSLPDMTLKGRLTGFDEPLGECSDNHGNVWIANNLKDEMLEFSHEGTRINAIKNAGPNPQACAVNPRNGAIAVIQLSGPGSIGTGEVYLYSKPSAKPTIVRDPDILYYEFGLYDPDGHVWIDGIDAFGTTILARCSPSNCSTIFLHGRSIFSAASIAWDKTKATLVVFDAYCRETPTLCSYPVSERGAIGAPTVYLSYTGGGFCTVIQTALAATGKQFFVVGGDSEYLCTSYKESTVDRWTYPAGGTPTNYKKGVVIFPWGAAVSAI